MKTAQAQVREFMVAAGQETPELPTIPSLEVRKLRAKLIMEEALETIEALGFGVYTGPSTSYDFVDNDFSLHEISEPDLVAIADGNTDSIVVHLGTLVACGIDIEPIWNEVHRSNMSKFIDGYRREDGKWIKGPSYSPADLKPIIEEQMKEK